MKEEEIVKKVCQIMDVKYHHYDNHNMGLDYFRNEIMLNITSKPKIVVYCSKFGYWAFAILEDMTVITPGSGLDKTLAEIKKVLNALEIKKGIKPSTIKYADDYNAKISKAEKWLKKNNCDKVINDKNKKVHLYW